MSYTHKFSWQVWNSVAPNICTDLYNDMTSKVRWVDRITDDLQNTREGDKVNVIALLNL